MVSCTTNKTEHARRGEVRLLVPIEVDHVSGSESEEEGGLERFGLEGIGVLQLRDDGTLREGL